MPLIFSVPEIFDLSQWGYFNIFNFDGTILAANSSPTHAGQLALTTRLSARTNWRILAQRFNWGNTTPRNVYYQLLDEKGFNTESTVLVSNQDNPDVLLFATSYIDILLWNISNPAVDVYVDCTLWYYTYERRWEENVMAVLHKPDYGKEQTKLLNDLVILERQNHDMLAAILRQSTGR